MIQQRPIRIAIIGTGNIGTDLCYRMLQDASFEVVAFVGRRADSPGIRMFENQVKYSIGNGIEGLIPYLNEVDGVFDATSAFDHQKHWEILSKAGKWVIDLTPSKVGLPIVPVLMNKTPAMHLQSESSTNYSMVTCGGQSSAPLLYALTVASTGIFEVEISSSIAALSAGPATRLNIDQYIESTENLTSIVSGCSNVKAILVINPAEPPVMMRTTVNMAVDTCDISKAIQMTAELIEDVQSYVPGYELVVEPHMLNQTTVSATVKVTGAGYVLPEYAGNLDIINAAAVKTAKATLQRVFRQSVMMKNPKLYDVTLRDGNHALRHTLTAKFVQDYCKSADASGVWAVEVGHGNGLGASSHLVGKSAESDHDLLEAARQHLVSAKLAVHSIPGFSTIKRDIKPAISIGVDIFRIATHVTEADTSQKHIEYLASNNIEVQGVLMMSHMIDVAGLIKQVSLMKQYGAKAVILMDSAGYFIPAEVSRRISAIRNATDLEIGFHAHNNLGLGVGNALAAISEGATVIDGASMGLGAGAGNAQLENIVAAGNREETIDSEIHNFLQMSKLVEDSYPDKLPRTTSSSTQSGLAGVFSGYAPQVKAISEELGLDSHSLWREMANRKLVAGQESMIREIAQDLMNL